MKTHNKKIQNTAPFNYIIHYLEAAEAAGIDNQELLTDLHMITFPQNIEYFLYVNRLLQSSLKHLMKVLPQKEQYFQLLSEMVTTRTGYELTNESIECQENFLREFLLDTDEQSFFDWLNRESSASRDHFLYLEQLL